MTEKLPTRTGIPVVIDPSWSSLEKLRAELQRHIDAKASYVGFQFYMFMPPTTTEHIVSCLNSFKLHGDYRFILTSESEETPIEYARESIPMTMSQLHAEMPHRGVVIFANDRGAAHELTQLIWDEAERLDFEIYHIKAS